MCVAIPGRILEAASPVDHTAMVEVSGVRRRVNLKLIEDDSPCPGDWVLIHVGFALSKISPQDAIDQMRILRILGEHEAAMEEVQGYGFGNAQAPGRQESISDFIKRSGNA